MIAYANAEVDWWVSEISREFDDWTRQTIESINAAQKRQDKEL